jgi:glycosyltransferase involved in cell wall biosynthesis
MAGQRLRIGIDAHAIGKRQTGNERFTANLIRGLRAICDHDLVLYFGHAEAARSWPPHPRTHVRLMRPDHAASRLLWNLPIGARRDRLDALIAQYVRPVWVPCPVLTVVHDVSFAVQPEHAAPLQRLWARLIPASMRRSAGVVTVSEFSRSEIRRLFAIPDGRITVAPNAVDPLFRREPAAPPLIETPFVLALGNIQPRKDLPTLVQAFRALIRDRPDASERLVVVGQPAYAADQIVSQADDLVRSGRIVFTGYLPDDHLTGLMRSAAVFAYPSVYEGFGLPLIEAMASGAPVVASDTVVTREVVGDAAVLVPPRRPEAWAGAIGDLLGDERRRSELAARGRERSLRFTPESEATPVLEAVERAIAGR